MEYEFILRLDRDPDPYADELFEAGLDDATIGTDRDGRGEAEFVRDAVSFWDAVTSAIADVHSTPVRVTAVQGDQLVTGTGIAEMLGMSRQHVTRLVSQPGFPRPVQRVGPRAVLYSGDAVKAWAWSTGKVKTEPASPTIRELELLKALNAALTWQNRAPALDKQSAIRIADLTGQAAPAKP